MFVYDAAEVGNYQEFSFAFERMVEDGSRLCFQDHASGKTHCVEVFLDDRCFHLRTLAEIPPVASDLVDLAGAICIADRLSPHRLSRNMRRIRVSVPLRQPEQINGDALEQLQELLLWATATRWEFDFVRRQAPLRLAESQSLLLPSAPPEAEVVLWSGGLDALAGVYARVCKEPDLPILLLGAGSNDRVFGKQNDLADYLKQEFPGRIQRHQVAIRIRYGGNLPKNKLMRTRGVVYAILGAVSAFVLDRNHLHVHENGIGALNLPYRCSSIGLDHVRSTHPFTHQRISRFISTVLGNSFTVTNPSFLLTKAQMCAPMVEAGRVDLPPLTESCDSYQRKVPGQCGYCASCLLRRQALTAAGLPDHTKYIITNGEPPHRDPSVPLRAMLAQVDFFKQVFHDPTRTSMHDRWERITRTYPELDDVSDRYAPELGMTPSDLRRRIMNMYERYVEEWMHVLDELSVGISDWRPAPASPDRPL